ncbi:hypothetical protein ACWEJ6_21105 [Nonomuraea sp. NPDC004702]
MTDTDHMPSLFSPEQVRAIREGIAGFGELAGNARAAVAAAGARLLALPPEVSQEENPCL